MTRWTMTTLALALSAGGAAVLLATGCATDLDAGTRLADGAVAPGPDGRIPDAGAEGDGGTVSVPPSTNPETNPPVNPAAVESYFPLGVGYTWTYRVSGSNVTPFTKVQAVERLEAVGGTGPDKATQAFVLRTTKRSGRENATLDQTVSWQNWVGGRLLRFREQSYQPGTTIVSMDERWTPAKLRLDGTSAHLAKGAVWSETFVETQEQPGFPPQMRARMETWHVVAVDEPVTVPRGTFNCLHVKSGSPGTIEKHWWFARGVGKVKEVGSQTEELLDHSLVTPPKRD